MARGQLSFGQRIRKALERGREDIAQAVIAERNEAWAGEDAGLSHKIALAIRAGDYRQFAELAGVRAMTIRKKLEALQNSGDI